MESRKHCDAAIVPSEFSPRVQLQNFIVLATLESVAHSFSETGRGGAWKIGSVKGN